MNNTLKTFEQFINENRIIENKVISYLNDMKTSDKKEYVGHIKTKYNPGSEWSDFGWIVDEINMFLDKEYMTSYTLLEFGDNVPYDLLDDILKKNFEKEYSYVLNNLK